MEGKYAMSDDFFPPSFIKAANAAFFVKCSNQSHKQGLIYSIQSLLSQKQ